MTYKVIEDFTDLLAGGRVYRKGDTFPDKEVSENRLHALSTKDNKRKTVLIEEVKTKQKKKATKDK